MKPKQPYLFYVGQVCSRSCELNLLTPPAAAICSYMSGQTRQSKVLVPELRSGHQHRTAALACLKPRLVCPLAHLGPLFSSLITAHSSLA